MSSRPKSLLEAESIVANWANKPPATPGENEEALLDA